MKAIALLVILFLIFLFYSSSSLSDIDLTPDTPPAQAAAGETFQNFSTEPQVISIQDAPVVTNPLPQVPVTGTCADPYTVQPGDVLSSIAVLCDVSIAEIRQANPEITNANLIYPGQQLRIPGAAAQAAPAQGQVILETPEGQQVSPPETQAQAVPLLQPTSTVVVPVTGPYPSIAMGTGVQVRGIDFPANTGVNIAIGPNNGTFTVVAAGATDANGTVVARITIPASTDSLTPWVVIVATSGEPSIQARSQPFTIAPTGALPAEPGF